MSDVDDFFNDMLAQEKRTTKKVQSILSEKESKRQKLETSTTTSTSACTSQDRSLFSITSPQSSYNFTSPQELLQSMQRDINCLTSTERSARLQAFNKLKQPILQLSPEFKQFLFPHILQQLLKCLTSDTVETCRENAAILLLDFVGNCEQQDDILSYVIPTLETRLNMASSSLPTPSFVEPSEEVRLLLSKTVTTIIKRCSAVASDRLKNFLDAISYILQRGYADYHEVKIEACNCTIALCQLLPSKLVSLFAPTLVKHLKPNLSHQRSSVREASVKALNELVMNGAHESIEDLSKDGILARLIVDASPSVRRITLETLQNWSFNLSDRWSYQSQLVYCICVALTDDVQSIQLLAKETLDTLGKMHEQENEKEVNDIKVYDADHKLSNYTKLPLPEPFHERPDLGCRMLVTKHAKKIITTILEDFTNWNIPKRLVAAKCLQRVILLCERNITQHLQSLVNEFFKANSEDEADILHEMQQAVLLTGYFAEPDTYIPLVWFYLKSEYATSPVLLSNVLSVYSLLLRGANPYNINWQVVIEGTMSKFSESHFLIYGDANNVKLACLKVVSAILDCSNDNQIILTNQMSLPLFTFIIRLCAQRGVSKEVASKGIALLEQIASNKQLSSIIELYAIHFRDTTLLLTQDVAIWDRTSANLFSFEALIKHGAGVSANHLDIIMPVFERHLSVDSKDLQVTLILFAALNQLLANIGSNPLLCEYLGKILELIAPNIVWKVGAIRMHIRKAAFACVNCLLRQGACTRPDHLRYLSDHMFSHLVSGIDETDDVELRIIAVKLFIDLIPLIHTYLVDGQWHTMTTELVARLDDVNQIVRTEACRALTHVLLLIPSDGDVEKEQNICLVTIKALMVHLDDESQIIRDSVYQCLSTIVAQIVSSNDQNKLKWIVGTIRDQAQQKMRVVRNCVTELRELFAKLEHIQII